MTCVRPFLRFNNAPTQGYEEHVGSKTSHRICTTQHFGFREMETEVVMQPLRSSTALKRFLQPRTGHMVKKTITFDTTKKIIPRRNPI